MSNLTIEDFYTAVKDAATTTLVNRIQVEGVRDIRKQTNFVVLKWAPFTHQRRPFVTHMNVDGDRDNMIGDRHAYRWAYQMANSFQNMIETWEKESELWRQYQTKRRNRWYRRLGRWITGATAFVPDMPPR